MTPGAAAAYQVGQQHEATLTGDQRARGAHYTPPEIAVALVSRSLRSWAGSGVPRVVDPTCGAGVFLVAAADALARSGVAPSDALRAVRGADLDPGAVHAARRALETWGAHHGVEDAAGAAAAVVREDGLDLLAALAARGGVDVVVGNPPFGSQLRGVNVRSGIERQRLREQLGDVVRGYVDVAGLFLVAARRALAPGGVCTMIQPRSLVAASHAAPIRREVVTTGRLAALWLPPRRVFTAVVHVCAPTVLARPGEGGVEVVLEPDGGPVASVTLDPAAPTWSPLVAAAQGVPAVEVDPGAATVGDVAAVTAGFRDEYYALADVVAERAPDGGGEGSLPLVTVGAIDVGGHTWGRRPQRFARRRWTHPVVPADRAGQGWWTRLAVPKVLVATQTRLVEAAADATGELVPVTPVVSVLPTPAGGVDTPDVHHLAAAICAPPVAALAHHRVAGAGMSPTTLRLRARDVANLPLPVDRTAWDAAVAAFTDAVAGEPQAWERYATFATQAYGERDRPDLVEWWLAHRSPTSGHPG